MKNEWPFKDPPDFAVFTSADVLAGTAPILFVTHDSSDGAWQFHSGLTPDMSKATMAELNEIVKLDSSITKLADLPLGGIAFRNGIDAEWTRSKKGK